MSKKLYLNVLWHMHQPYYRDDIDDVTLMPWVFLHCLKDYYDIPWYAQEFDGIKATYNLVPSLIYQIDLYTQNKANDKLLETIKKDISILNHHEIDFLQEYLFLSNEKNMIQPLSRYYELYLKFKTVDTLQEFHHQEILDTQVLFLLSWCGNYLRQNNTIVKDLLKKGSYFSQSEKLGLINTLVEFLDEILKYYKQLQEQNKITLCTTPYFHPITPLLLDINSAKEAKNDVVLPKIKSNFNEFGYANTKDAIDFFEEKFQKKPSGFWPAEGSVSYKTAQLFANNGLKWFCTDQDILFKTLNSNHKQNIYKNFRLNIDQNTIEVRFRDHYLSDAIGFEYSKLEPKVAAQNFLKELKDIYEACDFSPLVSIILDGENAWEFFPNNAIHFFKELYKLLEATPWLQCVTNDQISSLEDIEHQNIDTIASGSWINGNFDIWIGSGEKNKAWELLSHTKKDYENHKDKLTNEAKKKIEKEFMQALGSDWFWWYGDDHYTVLASQFDQLFRKHLINIYNLLELKVPNIVLTPIVQKDKQQVFHIKAQNFISPNIENNKGEYLQWLGCGVVDLNKEFSVMDSKKNIIKKIYYGYDDQFLYFKFSYSKEKIQGCDFVLLLNENSFEVPFYDGSLKVKISKNNISQNEQNDGKINVKLLVQDKKDQKIVQTFPLYDQFYIQLEDLQSKNWYI